mmetsp:Transcript_9412/g.35243  ORF Transcript_9412/g.35243 Transcript_9412/m.35243 type:complete len:98 (+) Transcript_9412:132-425(+)
MSKETAAFTPPTDALQAGLKGLSPAEAKVESKAVETEKEVLDNLEALYTKHAGDLAAIFAELGENPGKAQKYPPSSATEFATKYCEGSYTYVDDGAK